MTRFKLTYFLLFGLLFFAFGCKMARNVPQGRLLLKKNEIKVEGHKINTSEVSAVIKQQPNKSFLGLKMRLWAYNQKHFLWIKTDSLSIVKVRQKKYRKIRKINEKRIARRDKINEKRMAKARKRGDRTYYEKIVRLKDTLEPHLSFREWFKYKFGEPPVVLDTDEINRSLVSMRNYMMKKGYFYSTVDTHIDTLPKKRSAIVTYHIVTNEPYYIDSIKSYTENQSVKKTFVKFLNSYREFKLRGQLLDSDILTATKEKLAKFFRNEGYYGFNASDISMDADTSLGNYRSFLRVHFGDRTIKDGDQTYKVPQEIKYIRNVYFHIADSSNYRGNFSQLLKDKGININKERYLPTFDTIYYAKNYYTRHQKKKLSIPVEVDSLNPRRISYILYNGKPYVKPDIVELQNFLERSYIYKDFYVTKSMSRLGELNAFQSIRPVFTEVPDTNLLDVDYYLVPNKKQSFSFEPRFTNSNGFLGLSASVNYINRNLFRRAANLTISFSGGLESTPPVFDKNIDGTQIEYKRSLNTFEYGPTVKLDMPGLFPIPARLMTKWQQPITSMSVAYLKQHQPDFDREVFQFGYLYKFVLSRVSIMQIGLPFASSLKYVQIQKDAFFEQKLNETNDLFLRNAYSNQFIWEDLKLVYEFNNQHAINHRKTDLMYRVTFNHAGFIPRWASKKHDPVSGHKTIFGVAYTEFARLDNEFIAAYRISSKQSVHFHVLAGMGLPYGNIPTSMPYDYSFFGGGANDNRGWRARALGPGSYKYYLDPDRTVTQIGDIRLGAQFEYRYSLTSIIKLALFVDADNIWTLNNDENRPGAQFTKDFWREFAISPGFGLRLDFTYFILRLDLGIPFTNPALPRGSRWIFQSRKPYYQEGLEKFGPDYKDKMPRPFIPSLHFGIGYPF